MKQMQDYNPIVWLLVIMGVRVGVRSDESTP